MTSGVNIKINKLLGEFHVSRVTSEHEKVQKNKILGRIYEKDAQYQRLKEIVDCYQKTEMMGGMLGAMQVLTNRLDKNHHKSKAAEWLMHIRGQRLYSRRFGHEKSGTLMMNKYKSHKFASMKG